MKTATIREFQSNIAELIDGDEPVIVTRRGNAAALVLPLSNPKDVPIELRRQVFFAMTNDIARQLDTQGVTEEQIEREFSESKMRRRR